MPMCYSIQIENDIKEMAKRFDASYSETTYAFLEKNIRENGRVYKNTYAPAIIHRKGKREIVPLRFNLLPSFSETEKYQFFNQKKNKYEDLATYNAKIEKIEQTKAYQNLFMKHHCIIPFKSFFEWVKDENGKKVEIQFLEPENGDLFAAGLWDHWGPKTTTEEGINSFSIITTTPRPEVLAAGHHRSPVLLEESSIDKWILPDPFTKDDIYQMVTSDNKDMVLKSSFVI